MTYLVNQILALTLNPSPVGEGLESSSPSPAGEACPEHVEGGLGDEGK